MGNMPPEMRVQEYPKAVSRKGVERAVQTEERRWEGAAERKGKGKETTQREGQGGLTHSTILTKSSTPKPSSHPSKSASHNSSRPRVPHLSPEPLHPKSLGKHTSPEPCLRSIQLDYGAGLIRTYTESWTGRVESPDGMSRTERQTGRGKALAVRVSLTQGGRGKEEWKALRGSKEKGSEVKRVTVSLTEPSASKRQIGHKPQVVKPKLHPVPKGAVAALAELALVEKETVRQMFQNSKKGKEFVSLRNLSPSPLHSTLRLKPAARH